MPASLSRARRAEPRAQAQRLPGCTLLPGLIDAHVHLNLPGNGATLETAVRETDGVLTATATLSAVRALQAGITGFAQDKTRVTQAPS